MPGQSDDIDKGGTLRLGAYPCVIQPGTTMAALLRHSAKFPNGTATAMSSTTISATLLTGAGLTLSGLSPDGRLVETVELTEHPFFVGVQYHPEFKIAPEQGRIRSSAASSPRRSPDKARTIFDTKEVSPWHRLF